MGAWILNREAVGSSKFSAKAAPRGDHFSRRNRISIEDHSRQFLLSRRAKSKIRQLSKMLALEVADELTGSQKTVGHRY